MEDRRNEALEFITLSALAEAGQPVGSMRLAEAFQQAGHDLAQATAGRFLRQMDRQGLTDGEGGKRGRVITEKGLARLEELRGRMTLRENSSRLMDATTINDLSDLHELLLVRRVVESEGARLAAERASDAELAEIVKLAQSHVSDVRARRVPDADTSQRFHRRIAEASHNPVLISVALVLFEPANPMLLGVMENVSVSSSMVASYANEHLELAQALAGRNAARSEELMYDHITHMIAPVKERLSGSDHRDKRLVPEMVANLRTS